MSNESRLSDEQLRTAMDIFGSLSPENLTCDGELPKAEVQRRYLALKRKLAVLEAQCGRLDEVAVYKEYDRRGLRQSTFLL